MAVVESAKGASDIYCPISGTVVSTNSQVLKKPSLLNKYPENDSWICEIEINRTEFERQSVNLLSHQEYGKYCKNGELK